jgi:hypothetical protein
MSKDIVSHIPSQEALEKRFLFIENDILRTNLVIAFRYIIFLIVLEDENVLPGAISYSIYKNIILYTATIVESCIHYCLKKNIESGAVKSPEIMPWEWKNDSCVELYKISEERRVYGAVRHKASERFTDKTQFQTINRAAYKAKILNKALFDKAENLRKKRNRIHLAGLKKTDDFYEKKDIQTVFGEAKALIEQIENKLEELNSS